MKAIPGFARWLLHCITALVGLSALCRGDDPTLSFHFINVGQGAATLIEAKCGLVLIDAGAQDEGFADKLVAYLEKVFARRAELNRTIELVGITHTHIDHNLALRKVVERFTVKRYLDNGHVDGTGLHKHVTTPRPYVCVPGAYAVFSPRILQGAGAHGPEGGTGKNRAPFFSSSLQTTQGSHWFCRRSS